MKPQGRADTSPLAETIRRWKSPIPLEIRRVLLGETALEWARLLLRSRLRLLIRRLESLPGVSASEDEVTFDFVQFEELSRRIQEGDPKPKVPELSESTKEYVAGFLYAAFFFRIEPTDRT